MAQVLTFDLTQAYGPGDLRLHVEGWRFVSLSSPYPMNPQNIGSVLRYLQTEYGRIELWPQVNLPLQRSRWLELRNLPDSYDGRKPASGIALVLTLHDDPMPALPTTARPYATRLLLSTPPGNCSYITFGNRSGEVGGQPADVVLPGYLGFSRFGLLYRSDGSPGFSFGFGAGDWEPGDSLESIPPNQSVIFPASGGAGVFALDNTAGTAPANIPFSLTFF